MKILAADIGGTKTWLGLYERAGDDWVVLRQTKYASRDFASPVDMLRDFLGLSPAPVAGTIAIAGPIQGDRCTATNIPWIVNARELESQLGIPRVMLVNDFVAAAHGALALPDKMMFVLQKSEQCGGVFAVLGAGTGLGIAIGVARDGGIEILPTEGGHAAFAPRDEFEVQLWRELRARHGRVSIERVLSGSGLVAIFDLVVRLGIATPSLDLHEVAMSRDPAARIGEAAIQGKCAAARHAVDVFLSAYGAEAGDLALRTLASSIVLAGGIAPKLIELLRRGEFMEAFRDKGRMRPVVERVHVAVTMEPKVGLLGARDLAARLGS